MPQLGNAELRIIEVGLLASPGTLAKTECDRILKVHGYRRVLDFQDSIDKAAFKIAEGLAPGAGAEERNSCDDLLRDHGYVKTGLGNKYFGALRKPGPKPRAGRNSSRDAMQECIRAVRLLLLLEPSYTEHQVISLLTEIHEGFSIKRDAGVFFTRGDLHQIVQCLPALPERSSDPVRKTYRDALRTHNNLASAPVSELDYEKQLSLLPILNGPKITDRIRWCADENSLIDCFKQAEDFDIPSTVTALSARKDGRQSDCYGSLANILGISTASRPKIMEAAYRELSRIWEQYSGARFLAKRWALSIEYVFGAMDAEMMDHNLPGVAASDYSRILKTAVSRQYSKPFDDPIIVNWFER